MNAMKMLKLTLLSLTCVLTLGCQGDEINNFPPAPTTPAEEVRVHLVGDCRGGETSVACEDGSTTTPANRISTVTLLLRNAAGDPVATSSLTGGCATVPTPCVVEFPGLAAGTYSVTHTVTPTEGAAAAQAIYRDLIVAGI